MLNPKPQNRSHLRLISLGLMSVLLGSVALAQAYDGEKYAASAKIQIETARTIALKAHPGKIINEELEKESGGSGLRYSFDIRNHKVIQEVGIDAQTGNVLENDLESKHPD